MTPGSISPATAQTIIEGMVRAQKAYRLYPSDHPVSIKSIHDLHTHLVSFLDIAERLVYSVSRTSLRWEDQELYRPDPAEGTILATLSRDGIRELTFRKGIMEDEVREFINILALEARHASRRDDIVTRLWSDDFRHIRCLVYDPCLVDEPALTPSSNPGDEALVIARAHRIALAQPSLSEGGADVIDLSDRELLSLKAERAHTAADRTDKLLRVIFEILLLSESDEEFLEIEKIMIEAIDYALERRKVDVLAFFFASVKKSYLDSVSGYFYRASISRVVGYLSSEHFLSTVGRHMDEGMRLDDRTLAAVTGLLDRNAIPVLIDLLGHLETLSARKAIVVMLGSIGKSDVPALTRAINDERWYVVRNVVIALRMIGDRQARYYLIKCLHHLDGRVRRESLKALAEIEGEAAMPMLRDALDDPDASVRLTALGILSHIQVPTAKSTLLRRVLKEEFLMSGYDEKKEYFKALSHYDDEDVLDIFRDLLRKDNALGNVNIDETTAAIAYSLGMRGKADILEILEPLTTSTSPLVREAAIDALRRIRYGTA
jgi:hypothetical protein